MQVGSSALPTAAGEHGEDLEQQLQTLILQLLHARAPGASC